MPILDSLALRSARALYCRLRAGKNRLLNRLDPPTIILLYHRVAELPADPERLAVSPANFRRQMAYLKERYRLVRLDEDWPVCAEPAVAVTFDDGYADNALVALPILAEIGVPATFFVSTGNLGTERNFWWHELERLLLRKAAGPPRFELHEPHFRRSWDVATPAGRQALYDELNARMQRLDPGRREEWLRQLRAWAGETAAAGIAHRSLTHDELRTLAASPWATIGAHTVSHTALSALSEEQQRQEIYASKGELERIIGAQVKVFSYPFGRKKHYDSTSVRLCRAAGFARAASNFPGQVHRWTDRFQLPRHLVRDWDLAMFAQRMQGFWT